MIQRREKLIEAVETWPKSREDDAAAALEAMVAQDGAHTYVLSQEERRAIEASQAQALHGAFASDTDVSAILRKHRLRET